MKPRSLEHVALGCAIRELRRGAGISQEVLAERARLHRTYVGGIERGERNVSFGNLLRLADALGVRPSELFARYESLAAAAAAAAAAAGAGDQDSRLSGVAAG